MDGLGVDLLGGGHGPGPGLAVLVGVDNGTLLVTAVRTGGGADDPAARPPSTGGSTRTVGEQAATTPPAPFERGGS